MRGASLPRLAARSSHVRAEVQELKSRMHKKMAKDKQPAAQLEFEGIQGCKLGMPKFASQRRADNYHRVKTTRPTKNEAGVIWPNIIFAEEDFLVADAEAHGKVFRVHQVVIDEGLKAPDRWQLMYYDVELSHTRYDDGAPCDCEEHGGRECLMESATVGQVVTWLQKFGDQIPKKLDHVRSSS
jgi:hypothetical protein